MSKTCFCGISEHCGYQIETDMEQHDKVIFKDGYNKAIDEFLHNAEVKITDRILQNQARLDFASGLAVANRLLDEVAEQMKGGAV